jgi:integrase
MQRPEELPSGRWRGIARDAVSGKRVTKTFDRYTQANAWAIDKQAEMDGDYAAAGIEVTRQERGIPSLAEHVVEWAKGGLADGEKSTLRNYRSQARMLAARWPTQRVDEITELMIRAYLVELREAGMGPGTATVRLTVLRHCMHAAIRAGYRLDDPTVTIKGPKVPEHQARILTEPELMLLLAYFPGWLWPAALLSHDAGLRIGEVAGLRMCNLNLLHSKVTIADVVDVDASLRPYPKSKIIRDVPLSPRVVTALRDHVRDQGVAGKATPVFPNPRTRGHLRPDRIRDEWDRALERAGIEGDKPTWHDLRHGCATTLAECHADPFVIQAILGHGSIATTQRYVRKADLSRQAAAVNHAFGGQQHQTG